MVLPAAHAQGLATPAITDNCPMPSITSDDPLDFFGAIRDLVERGLSVEERAKYGAVDGGGPGSAATPARVCFPRVGENTQQQGVGGGDEAEQSTSAVVAALQQQLEEATQRNALVRRRLALFPQSADPRRHYRRYRTTGSGVQIFKSSLDSSRLPSDCTVCAISHLFYHSYTHVSC